MTALIEEVATVRFLPERRQHHARVYIEHGAVVVRTACGIPAGGTPTSRGVTTCPDCTREDTP